MAKNAFRKNVLFLHKIIGLVTGLVVFAVAITGCCWVFKEEIESLYEDFKEVAPQDKPVLTVTKAKEIAEEVLPNHLIHGTLYEKPNNAIEVIFYEDEPVFYQSVYLNPYSGEVLHVKDHLKGFFSFMLDGHVSLWLPLKIGMHVVRISILLFLLMLVTGIILWWPKKRKNLIKRLKFKWIPTTRWKRKNFDLHSILGVYVSFLALVIAFTGCVMAYEWFYYITYKGLGGKKTPEFMIPNNINNTTDVDDKTLPIDQLIPKLQKENPEAESFELHYPYSDSTSIYVEVSNAEGIYYNSDYRFFDQYTLEEVETPSLYGKYEDATVSDKIIRMNYDIHIGAIGGLTGKIIAFFVSLLTASLPVTGTLLWYGRKYK